MKKPLKKRNRLVIGLTGSFGTGKTTVAEMLKAYGARIIDADAIGHCLLKPGTRPYRAIVRRFGSGVLAADKTVDRHRLSALVFGSRARLAALNAIMHPEIIRIVKKKIAQVRKGVVVLDAPLLFEAGGERMVNRLVVVAASQQRQIQRVQAQRRMRAAAVIKRIRSQIPLRDKVRMADFVIDNNGTRSDLRRQVAEIRRMWWIS
jgi:dephospho-CoA kinase